METLQDLRDNKFSVYFSPPLDLNITFVKEYIKALKLSPSNCIPFLILADL